MARCFSTVVVYIQRGGRGARRENITRGEGHFSPGLPGGRHISYGSRVLERKPWEAEAVLALLMGLFLIFGMGGIVASVLPRPASNGAPAPSTTETASPASASPKPAFSAFVLGTLTFHGAVLLLVHRFVRMHRVRWADAFGWRRSGVSRALGAGVTVAGVAVPVAYGLQWLSVAALRHWGRRWGYEPGVQGSVELLLHAGSWAESAYIFVFATLVAPVAEELLFRGILFPFIRDLGKPRLAFWGTAVLFGAMHGNLAAFVPLVFFGALLAALYLRTGNLLAPMTAHALFNLVPFLLLACGLKSVA
jgi:membrane protease YdiL (CAAX protease family)